MPVRSFRARSLLGEDRLPGVWSQIPGALNVLQVHTVARLGVVTVSRSPVLLQAEVCTGTESLPQRWKRGLWGSKGMTEGFIETWL